jgi:hypothetical protein
MQPLQTTHTTQAALTRDSVVDDLVARLGARRSLAMRRHAAYGRLARLILAEAVPLHLRGPQQAKHGTALAAA